MKVILIAYTPEPEKLIASAARLCYSGGTIDDVRGKLDDSSAREFVEMLSELGHESPIEHISFTFGIEGVSRALLAQITRHRIASFSVQSQRYVKEGNFDYVIPPAIEAIPEAKAEFIQAMEEAQRYYDSLSTHLKNAHKKELIASGMDPKEAARAAGKMSNEDARFVLPNACDTKMIVTMNARSLINFFHHRCCSRAQWEIRAVADEMLRIVREVAPSVFAQAGPPCLTRPCPEGKMSCGRMMEIREKYKAIEAK